MSLTSLTCFISQYKFVYLTRFILFLNKTVAMHNLYLIQLNCAFFTCTMYICLLCFSLGITVNTKLCPKVSCKIYWGTRLLIAIVKIDVLGAAASLSSSSSVKSIFLPFSARFALLTFFVMVFYMYIFSSCCENQHFLYKQKRDPAVFDRSQPTSQTSCLFTPLITFKSDFLAAKFARVYLGIHSPFQPP